MFRRREDEMNDTDIPSQGSLLNGGETVKVLTPEASAYATPHTPTHNTAPAGSSYLGSTQRAAAPESSRPNTAPAASNNFRPAQQQQEASRTRAPESKSNSSFGTSVSQGASPIRESRRVLTVGSDILLKGEIATCDRLVIEGKVDAVLNDVGTVELAENGSFKGVAQVENAEISGLFEGELLVKGRLVIYASGRVRGKITYGEIEIERGGELTGEVKTMAAANATRTGARSVKEEKEKTAA